MIPVFRAGYERLGPKYPRRVLGLQLMAAYVIVAAGIVLLTVYQPLDGHFWDVLLVGEALITIENVLAYRMISRLLRPVDAWLHGDRSSEASAEAWRALAALPSRFTRAWRWMALGITVVPFCAYVTLVLELSVAGFGVLVAAGCVLATYGLFLRFFGHELALRPVLEDVSADLPDDFDLGPAGISLRARLLLALPLLNIITGLSVAGLSSDGPATLADLGGDVAFTVLVAFTVAFELTWLLARSVIDPIRELQAATARVTEGDLDVRVPVVSTDETGRLAQSFNQAVAGLAERRRLLEAVGVYVDPEVAERVLREGVAIEGEEVDVSVLFVDVRDFTAMADGASARELVQRLNALFDTVVPVISRHGGHANAFIGDGLLAVFGAPDRLPDHADRAVDAAQEAAAAVWSRFGEDLRVGIGVNSGQVIAGSVGGGSRFAFTVIGDPVNTAARVEEATRLYGDAVLVTAATRSRLDRRRWAGTLWTERRGVLLKGKADPVTLYAPPARRSPGSRRDAQVLSAD